MFGLQRTRRLAIGPCQKRVPGEFGVWRAGLLLWPYIEGGSLSSCAVAAEWQADQGTLCRQPQSTGRGLGRRETRSRPTRKARYKHVQHLSHTTRMENNNENAPRSSGITAGGSCGRCRLVAKLACAGENHGSLIASNEVRGTRKDMQKGIPFYRLRNRSKITAGGISRAGPGTQVTGDLTPDQCDPSMGKHGGATKLAQLSRI